MEKTEYEPTRLEFSRKKDGEVMGVKLTYRGEGKKSEVLMSVLDGVMEGLIATMLVEMNVKTNEEMTADVLTKGWESVYEVVKGHSSIHSNIKEYVENNDWGKDEEQPNIDDMLLADACSPTIYNEKIQLWNDEETVLEFENQINVGYPKIVINGTLTSVKQTLIFLLFYLMIAGYRLDNEETLLPTLKKVIKMEIKRFHSENYDEVLFEQYLQPWLNALQNLK